MTEALLRPEEWAGGACESRVHRAAAQLCGELAAGAVREPMTEPARGFLAWLRDVFAPDAGAEVDRHRRELATTPPRPLAVLRFARFLERHGFTDLCPVPWSLLHRLCPHDPEPAVALAELFLARARRADRDVPDRLRDYGRFFRYANRALVALPADHPVRAWHTAAGVEATILKGKYGVA